MKEKFEKEKPWAILGVSRKSYDALKPWKKMKLSREEFGNKICSLPPEVFNDLRLHADANILVDSLFGKLEED